MVDLNPILQQVQHLMPVVKEEPPDLPPPSSTSPPPPVSASPPSSSSTPGPGVPSSAPESGGVTTGDGDKSVEGASADGDVSIVTKDCSRMYRCVWVYVCGSMHVYVYLIYESVFV